jgi:hypothetical protein
MPTLTRDYLMSFLALAAKKHQERDALATKQAAANRRIQQQSTFRGLLLKMTEALPPDHHEPYKQAVRTAVFGDDDLLFCYGCLAFYGHCYISGERFEYQNGFFNVREARDDDVSLHLLQVDQVDEDAPNGKVYRPPSEPLQNSNDLIAMLTHFRPWKHPYAEHTLFNPAEQAVLLISRGINGAPPVTAETPAYRVVNLAELNALLTQGIPHKIISSHLNPAQGGVATICLVRLYPESEK